MAERTQLNAIAIPLASRFGDRLRAGGGMDRSVRVAEVGVPLHPAAERFWRECGYLR
jgi:TRAP-type uncharacterized transport system substrate-binding protein